MEALKVIGWFVLFLTSVSFIYETVGIHRMVCFFQEGKRWYQIPLQWLSLGIFAAVVINHPF